MSDQKDREPYDKTKDPNWHPLDWENKETTLRTVWIVLGIIATATFAACVWATASDDSNKRYVPHGAAQYEPFTVDDSHGSDGQQRSGEVLG